MRKHREGKRSHKFTLFPMPEPNHFSDYGFDPQIDFFQGLDQLASMRSRNRRRDDNSTISMDSSSFHFKLQKPISKDESRTRSRVKNKQNQSQKWWQTAFLFFQKGFDYTGCRPSSAAAGVNNHALTLIGTTTPPPPPPPAAENGEEIPSYVNLRELNMEAQVWRNATSAMPLYLVT